MIFTVTLNPALDKTVVIPDFAAGRVNRMASIRIDAGGKGVNVSKCLQALGVESTAALILAGSMGRELERMLKDSGIQPLVHWVDGQTRTNLKIIDPEKKENTDINEPGPAVTQADLNILRDMIREKLRPGDLVILSGSLPAGTAPQLYRDWILYFKELGAMVLMDADGEALRWGLQAAPYMIKPNNDELVRLRGVEKLSREEMICQGRQLLDSGIEDVVISLGGDGALFLSREGIFRADSLPVSVKSTVGAGDSMVAAMACGMVKQLPRKEQIALAVAMGAASVMQDGSQAPDSRTVCRLAQQVVIEKL